MRPFIFEHKSLLLICKNIYQECLPIYYQQVTIRADFRLLKTLRQGSSTSATRFRHLDLVRGVGGHYYRTVVDKLTFFQKLQRVTLPPRNISLSGLSEDTKPDSDVIQRLIYVKSSNARIAMGLISNFPEVSVYFQVIVLGWAGYMVCSSLLRDYFYFPEADFSQVCDMKFSANDKKTIKSEFVPFQIGW